MQLGGCDSRSRCRPASGRVVHCHIKVETGTNRQGVSGDELTDLVQLAGQLDGLILEGLTTHFADVEDTTDHSFAEGR